MQRTLVKAAVTGLAAVLLVGCATSARQLMPTPALYQLPGGQPVFDQAKQTKQSPTPDLDLLFITDRAPETEAEGTLPYGQERARRITFAAGHGERSEGR